MNLIVEIGNTALKAVWTEGLTLGKIFRYQGERKIDFIISIIGNEKPDILTLSSVFEIPASDKLRLSSVCGELLVLDPGNTSVLGRYGFPHYLTYDRAASMVAASHIFKGKACTVFDFGTTITIDEADSEGNYVGGNISLGCMTRFKALNRYSKALPLVNIPSEITDMGTSLNSSIEAGVISGIVFEIQGYLDRKPENIVVFTGGDAIYFVKKMKNSIFAICNLVLMGLALITDDYVRKDNQ